MSNATFESTAEVPQSKTLAYQAVTGRLPTAIHENPEIQDASLQNRTHSEPVVVELRPGQLIRSRAPPPSSSVASEIRKYLVTEFWTHLHASCPACHHWHNGVAYKVKPKDFNQFRCEREACRHVIVGLGGNDSHESLMSQLTITNSSAGHRIPGPCNNDDVTQAVKLDMSTRSTGTGLLEPVRETETFQETHSPKVNVEESATSESRNAPGLRPACLPQGEPDKSVPIQAEDGRPANKDDQPVEMRRKSILGLINRLNKRFSKFRFPLEFRWPVRRRKSATSPGPKTSAPKTTRNLALLRNEDLNAQGEFLEPGIIKDGQSKQRQAFPHSEQTQKSSTAPTLYDQPSILHQGYTNTEVEPSRAFDNGAETKTVLPSYNDNKEERRLAKRTAMTEDKLRQCACSEACHCVRPSSNNADVGSTYQSHSIHNGEYSCDPWSVYNIRQGESVDITIPRNHAIEMRAMNGGVVQVRSEAADSIHGSSRSSSWNLNVMHRRQSNGVYPLSTLGNELHFLESTEADGEAGEASGSNVNNLIAQNVPWHPTRRDTGQTSLDSMVLQSGHDANLSRPRDTSGTDSSSPSPQSSSRAHVENGTTGQEAV